MADEVFVGRRDELARFAAFLTEFTADRVTRSRRWKPVRHPETVLETAGRSRVVLVHGLGGSGKSRLLSHFRDMALGAVPGSPVPAGTVRAVWLDWEDERQDDPGTYAGVEDPSLVTVLDALQKAVVDAFGADGRAVERVRHAFGSYRQGAARMPEYAARFADLLAQSRQTGSPFTREDTAALAKAAASALLVTSGHPGGILGLSPDQLAAAAQAGGRLSASAVRAVAGKKPGEISLEEYNLVMDPARELTRRAAAAIRMIASQGPLLVLLDTGEVIGERAWRWLRRVMTHTGPGVAWVVGARFETEAQVGPNSPVAQFEHDIGNEHLTLMSPTRFDDAMIRDYLESRPSARSYSGEQIGMIAHFTRGLPLAVSIVATLLDEGQPVEVVCQDVDHRDPSSAVAKLARRFLVHVESYPADDVRRGDEAKILGLALAFGDLRDDPELLSVLLNTEDPLSAFQDLASRHDFVMPASRRLHDDVRRTLLTDLLDPYRRVRVREINERALTLMLARLERMRGRWPTLDEQVAHTAFTTTLLAVLWHTLWMDNQAGLDLFSQILHVLALTHPSAAEAATEIVEQFAGTFDQNQRGDLEQFIAIRPNGLGGWMSGRSGTATREAASVTISLSDLALQAPAPGAHIPLVGDAGDRQVTVTCLRASLQALNHDHQAAVATLQAAAAQATSNLLRQVIGLFADNIADALIWAGRRATVASIRTGLAAAKIATDTLPDNARAWNTYGTALYEAGRFHDALAAYDRAIALDPGNISACGNRGNALDKLERFEDALAAYDQAIALDPGQAVAHKNRGKALDKLERFEDALAAHDHAIALDPGDADAHISQGVALAHMNRREDALVAFDQAIALDPANAHAHYGRGDMLYYQERYEDALAAFDQAIVLHPGFTRAHTDRGMTLKVLGRFEDALAAFDQAIALNPKDASAHQGRGLALKELGRFEDALAAFDDVTALTPGNAQAHTDRGSTLFSLHRFEDSLAAFDQAIALDHAIVWAHFGRGFALQMLGRFEDALAAFDDVTALTSGHTYAHYSRGLALKALGRFEEALAAFDQAIALDPGNTLVRTDRGLALLALGWFEDALAAHDQAITLNPSSATAYNGLGYTLLYLERFEDALAAIDQAIAIDPSKADAHENRGIGLAAIGKSDQALAEFDFADRLAPDRVGEGRTWAGAILWHRRDPAGAHNRFMLVKGRLGGSTPFHTAELEAIALCGLGKPDDAEQHLLAAVPLRAPGDRAGPRTIYDLLSDPPLPGIDRLRAIVETGT